MNSVTLSTGQIREEHREALLSIELRQPTSVLEDLAVDREGSELAIPWPGSFIAYYGRVDFFVSGMALIGAHTAVPKQTMIAALSTIRSRVLGVATEIQCAAPEAGEGIAGADPLPRAVSSAVTQNIYGGSVAIGTGPVLALSGPIGQLVAGGNASNLTLADVLDRLTQDVEAAEAPEDEKAKVRRWLGEARAAVSDTGSTVAAKFLAELVARGLGN